MNNNKEVKSAESWNLSREKMPDFDGWYYVYGFMNHPCGNVTSFYKVVECRMNQWVKSDEGEQMTYWRKNLPAPNTKDSEHQFIEIYDLHYVKDSVSKSLGYEDWETLICIEDGPPNPEDINTAVDKIAIDHASQQTASLQSEVERLKSSLRSEVEVNRVFRNCSEKDADRIKVLEGWMVSYRYELERTNVFHKNQGIINSINQALTGSQSKD